VSNERHTVIISGATAGLGLALARVYAARGTRLVLLGRQPLKALDAQFFTDETYCQVDLADLGCAVAVEHFLRERGIAEVDLLIHNAGVGFHGSVARQDPDNVCELVTVNLRAPIALSHALLPALWRAGGTIAFIGSVAATLPVPEYAVYGATKGALEGFARSLRVELAGQVAVRVIHPGAIRTAMHAKSGMAIGAAAWRRYPSPERVAMQVVRAIEHGPATTVLGPANRALRFAGRHGAGIVDALARQRGLRYVDTAPQQSGREASEAATRHCVITGAADGIGRALARAFGAAGYVITGIDRDAALSARTGTELVERGIAATFIHADLTERADVDRLLDRLAGLGRLDCLIHCAGISAVGRFAGSNLAAQDRVLDLNLLAPLLLTGGLLARQRLARGGTLVFVASLSCFTGYPGASVYAASKDGVASYARSIRVGLAAAGVHVLTVYPGPTRTAHARRYSPDNRREARRMPPEQLAALVLAAVQAGQHTLIPGKGNRAFALFGRLAPSFADAAMRKALLDKLDRARQMRGGVGGD
jgi:short-subunit dehydrogenase